MGGSSRTLGEPTQVRGEHANSTSLHNGHGYKKQSQAAKHDAQVCANFCFIFSNTRGRNCPGLNPPIGIIPQNRYHHLKLDAREIVTGKNQMLAHACHSSFRAFPQSSLSLRSGQKNK